MRRISDYSVYIFLILGEETKVDDRKLSALLMVIINIKRTEMDLYTLATSQQYFPIVSFLVRLNR